MAIPDKRLVTEIIHPLRPVHEFLGRQPLKIVAQRFRRIEFVPNHHAPWLAVNEIRTAASSEETNAAPSPVASGTNQSSELFNLTTLPTTISAGALSAALFSTMSVKVP